MFNKNRTRIACIVSGLAILFIAANCFAGIGDAQSTRELGKAMVSGLEGVPFFKWILAVIGFIVMFVCGTMAFKELGEKNYAKGIVYAICLIPGWYMTEWVIDILKGAFQ